MSKKALAAVLSALLVFTSIASALSFSAFAASLNLVDDGKFEGESIDWVTYSNTGNAADTFQIEGDDSGHYLYGKAGLSMFKAISLEKDVEYAVSFDFKLVSDTVPANYDSFYRAGFTSSVGVIGNSIFTGPNETGNKYYNIYSHRGENPTAWKTHTFRYTPSENMNGYFVIGSYNGQCLSDFLVDNVYICKTSDLVSVSVSADEGGTASGTVVTYRGDTVRVIASADAGYLFEGWYDAGGVKCSDLADYSFTLNSNLELTAKFIEGIASDNLITGGDFKTGSISGFEVYKNGTAADFVATENGADDYFLSGVSGLSLYKQVTLKADTEYTMSFDFRFLSNDVPANYDSFYRAGFVSSVSALGNSNFVGPYASGNKYYSIYIHQSSDATSWKNHTFTFTPAEDMTVYAVIGSYNHQGVAAFELDNWKLTAAAETETVAVTAVAETGGSVRGSATVPVGETVTVTATPDAGYVFVGWYQGDTPVSTEAAYTFTVSEAITLTAKFKRDNAVPVSNYIVNGDFEIAFTPEKIVDNGWDSSLIAANAGKWGRLFSGVARMDLVADFTDADSAELNGSRYLTGGATTDANQYIRGIGQFVELPAGEYVLAFVAKSDASNLFAAGVYKEPCVVSVSADGLVKQYLTESAEWKQYVLPFTVTEPGYYQVGFGGNTQGKGELTFSLDNVVLCKKTDYITVTAVTDGGGTVTAPIGRQTVGEAVTVTAMPDDGYRFTGWYIGGTLVSGDMSYTFTVIESVELKAVFELDLNDDGIIKNGGFDTNSTAGWTVIKTGAGAGNLTVEVDPDTGSAVAVAGNPGYILFQKVHLEKNVEYIISFDFKFEAGAEVPSTYTSFYRSGFTKEPTNLTKDNLVGPYKTGEPYYDIFAHSNEIAMSAWKNHSYAFTPDEDMDTYFAVGSVDQSGAACFSVDNIGIYRADSTLTFRAAAVSHGGSGTVTSTKTGVVPPNEAVTLSATPNEGSVFGGWYENGTLISMDQSFTFTVRESAVVYARFLDPTAPNTKQMLDNSDFSTGDLTGWGVGNTESSTCTVQYMSENGERFVRVGKSDSLYQTVELRPGKSYMIRITSRIEDIAEINYDKTLYRFGLSKLESPNVLQRSSLHEAPDYTYTSPLCEEYADTAKWQEYTYSYVNNSDSTMLVNVVVGAPYCEYPIDILRFEFFELSDGVLDFHSPILYAEEFYNFAENGTFEQPLSDANWGATLPNGWELLSGHKETGDRYLSVCGDQTRVYRIPVRAGYTYVVGFSLRTGQSGTSSVSIVDRNGTPLGDAFSRRSDTAVFSPKANNMWQRMGAHVYVTGEDGNADIYIKITGGSNRLDIDDITVARLCEHTYDTDPNYYGPTSFDYSTIAFYNPTLYYAPDDTTGLTGAADSGDNADTGDFSYPCLAVLLLIFSCVTVAGAGFATAVRTRRQRKEDADNE